jgi:hypothetical protein
MTVLSARSVLRDHLRASGIAGAVATSRESNLASYRNFASGTAYHRFGLTSPRPWTADEVLAVMARRCGVDPDPQYLSGPDTIDPELTLAALDAAAGCLAEVVAAQGSVLLATGHPSGLLQVHLGLAAALREAGCTLLTPAAGWRYTERRKGEPELREIRYVSDVAMVSDRGALNHTHSSRPMQGILAELTESGAALPDLVVADHGWAGASAEAGVRVVGFADSNDPALFVGQEEGKLGVVVPLDDNVTPHLYLPVVDYLREAAGI